MMSELRVGGLAMIIMSLIPDNIGKVVELVEFIGCIDKGPHRNRKDIWRIQPYSSSLVGHNGIIKTDRIARCPGEWLMPIDGEDFSHEDERQKELTNG
ncbi:hypothetical protein I5495_08025 [Citrobacter amalonaticus]|uniref:hypothetical protein n=1 Tax=Citrobacter amalonaticus TaxID=35703 RepID=UPI001903A099|nr:hypothetical protein [Citrobacter amalonaticus]MBJ9257277.1 hypothetical protein [Citrobacter amalonaticus]